MAQRDLEGLLAGRCELCTHQPLLYLLNKHHHPELFLALFTVLVSHSPSHMPFFVSYLVSLACPPPQPTWENVAPFLPKYLCPISVLPPSLKLP